MTIVLASRLHLYEEKDVDEQRTRYSKENIEGTGPGSSGTIVTRSRPSGRNQHTKDNTQKYPLKPPVERINDFASEQAENQLLDAISLQDLW